MRSYENKQKHLESGNQSIVSDTQNMRVRPSAREGQHRDRQEAVNTHGNEA